MEGNDAKRPRFDRDMIVLGMRDKDVVVVNSFATNAEIPKDGVIRKWTTNTVLKENSNGFQYSLSMKTHVYDFEKEEKTTIEKYIQDRHETKCVWKYKEFPLGA